MDLTRRTLLLGSAALATTGASASPSPNDLHDWLTDHAHPLRTLDPTDENYTDLEPLEARASNLYQRFGSDAEPEADGGLASQNRRDACNADNLRWLLEQDYPGRKLIVWAHNAHVMNAYYEAPNWKTIRLDAAPNTMKPHGVFLKSWLGRNVYTIGCTTYEGEDGWKGLGNTPIPAASEASIEGQLKKIGHAYAFLDLQRARGPMRHAQVMRVPKFDEVSVSDPTQPYDGLLFIARMERGKQIGIGQG